MPQLRYAHATPSAAIVIIGSELLSGSVADLNSSFLVKELRALGVATRRIAFLEDDVDQIAAEIRTASSAHSYVLCCGGVGPTHDDVTMAAIARAFGVPLVRDAATEAMLKDTYGKDCNEYVLKMADFPQGYALLRKEGVPWPFLHVKNVYIFPGVPKFLQAKFETFKETFRSTPFLTAQVEVSAPESAIAAYLHEAVERHRDVRLGSYPVDGPPGVKVLLTLESKDAERLRAAFESLLMLLPREVVVSSRI
eukprot:tig00000237_g20487.t1